MKLKLPLKHIQVNQPFGVNYLDFYKQWGLKGHNGIDFKARNGCPVYAAHSGKVLFEGKDGDGGVSIVLWNKIASSIDNELYKTIYYHLKETIVKIGQDIIVGDKIGLANNTGKFTTSDHLHFMIKMTDGRGNTINLENGYKGAMDPSFYFPKNWDRSRAYHRYGKERSWLAEYYLRFAPQNIVNRWTEAGRYLHKRMLRMGYASPVLSGEQVNAILYGAWDADAILNPAMYENWSQLTKAEYVSGQRPYL